jgi:hypothetical protein
MIRVSVKARDRIDFHNFTLVDDCDSMRDVADGSEVVRDKERSEAPLLLEVADQIKDLSLHGRVQCRDSFIEDDQVGVGDYGARDGDSLALATGQLVRAPLRERCAKTDSLKHLLDGGATAAAGCRSGDDERFGYRSPYTQMRV